MSPTQDQWHSTHHHEMNVQSMFWPDVLLTCRLVREDVRDATSRLHVLVWMIANTFPCSLYTHHGRNFLYSSRSGLSPFHLFDVKISPFSKPPFSGSCLYSEPLHSQPRKLHGSFSRIFGPPDTSKSDRGRGGSVPFLTSITS